MNSNHIKLPLILILLLLGLGLGQVALAANCAPPNECKVIDNCSTGQTLDECPASTPPQFCCAATCVQPNVCKSSTECLTGALDPAIYTCSGSDVCCPPAAGGNTCTNCKASCATTEESDTTKTCPAATPPKVCCKPKAGSSPCTTAHPTYSCIDKGTRADCLAGKCPGTPANIQCCPPGGGVPTGGGGATSVSFGPGELSPIGEMTIPTLIGVIVKGALGIVGSIALLMFVYGGFILLISQGDSTKITKGKITMTWAAVGIMIIFGSYIFVSYIISGLTGTGGGSAGGDTCGTGTYAGYSCQTVSADKICQPGLCPGGADNQCCKPK